MTMTTQGQLTEREREALEHFQKAQELGSTLSEYAAAFNLDVKELYAAKQQLARKGALAGRAPAEAPQKPEAFVPVRIVPAAPPPLAAMAACRLVHPSGWVVECGERPEPSWISALLRADAHAAA